MFGRQLVLFIEEDQSFADIIRLCALRLQQEGCIEDAKTFTQMVLEREAVYPTLIDNGVYFPHPLVNDAKKTRICVAIVRGSSEKEQPMHLLFVTAHEAQVDQEMIHIYNLINKVAASQQLVSVLMSLQNENELIDYLERIFQIV